MGVLVILYRLTETKYRYGTDRIWCTKEAGGRWNGDGGVNGICLRNGITNDAGDTVPACGTDNGLFHATEYQMCLID